MNYEVELPKPLKANQRPTAKTEVEQPDQIRNSNHDQPDPPFDPDAQPPPWLELDGEEDAPEVVTGEPTAHEESGGDAETSPEGGGAQ